MQYALLIYTTPGADETLSPAEAQAVSAEYWALRDEPAVIGGAALQSAETATTIRFAGTPATAAVTPAEGAPAGGTPAGRAVPATRDLLITDGPFADTKEIFGGYYLIEAENLDQATELAARIPALRFGGAVEIRPIMGRH